MKKLLYLWTRLFGRMPVWCNGRWGATIHSDIVAFRPADTEPHYAMFSERAVLHLGKRAVWISRSSHAPLEFMQAWLDRQAAR